MKIRKAAGTTVASLWLIVSLVAVHPASASGTGLQSDPVGDTIDYVKHAQNSFRPPAPYDTYQYSPTPIQDIVGWQFDAGTIRPGFYTAEITLPVAAPRDGDPVTSLPAGFSSLQYSWYFQTNLQDSKQQIGTDCVPLRNQGEGYYSQNPLTGTDILDGAPGEGNIPDASTAVRFSPAGGNTCAAATALHPENQQPVSATPPAPPQVPVAAKRPIFEPPHPRADGWWLAIVVDYEIVNDGPGPHNGHFCKALPAPAPANTYPTACLGSRLQWGIYEGYSGFQTTLQEDINNVGPAFGLSFPNSGRTIRVQAPYNPQIFGSDGDGLLDDLQLWPTKFGQSGGGAVVSAVVPETSGLVTVGTSQVCSFVDPVLGGTDCEDSIGGAGTGFITVRDWAPAGAFELRQVPRSPAYAPSAASASCRYPAGHFPAPPAGVTVAPAPSQVTTGSGDGVSGDTGSVVTVRVPGSIGYDTTPYSRPWWIEPRVDQSPTGSLTTTINGVSIPGATAPAPTSVSTGLGRDQSCSYTQVPTGLHYNDVLGDFPMS